MKDRDPGPGAIGRTGQGGAASPRVGASPRFGARLPEIAFALFGTLVYLGVHLGLNRSEDDAGDLAPDGMATILQAIVLLGGAGFVVRHRRTCANALVDVWPFLLLLALAALSSLWSQAPDVSLRRSVTLATLLMFAVFAHGVLGTLIVCRVQVAAMWVAAFASFAMAALVPASGFDIGGYAGAVRGVFTQKNTLGDAMVVGTVALAGMVLNRRRIVWTDIACWALAAGTIVVAKATTSFLLCTLVAATTVVMLLVMDASLLALFGLASGLLAVAVAGWLVYAVPIDLFDLLGKDPTLTGRADIWAAVRRVIEARPALGYGYSAFWLQDGHAAQDVWAAIGWIAPSAHSGYLEIRLELGLAGLALMAAIGLATVLAAIAAGRAGRWAAVGWTTIVLTVILIVNTDESSMPRPDIHLLQWTLAFAACHAAARRRPVERRFPPHPDRTSPAPASSAIQSM